VSVQLSDRTHHFELELRNAVTVAAQRKVLENQIGRAAIGGRLANLFGRNQRIWKLRLRAPVDAHRHVIEIELSAIGPDAPHARDLAIAKREGKIAKVGIGRGGHFRPTAFAALPFGG
jgi:hypothetical protein